MTSLVPAFMAIDEEVNSFSRTFNYRPHDGARATRDAIREAFGYTQEDIGKFLEPMAVNGDDPIGSMGTDTPIAVLSDKSRLLYDYFKQNFAQVTNPPIDPIREELVMSLLSMIGPRPNLLGHAAGTHKRLEVEQPILTNRDLEKIRSVEASLDGADHAPLDGHRRPRHPLNDHLHDGSPRFKADARSRSSCPPRSVATPT